MTTSNRFLHQSDPVDNFNVKQSLNTLTSVVTQDKLVNTVQDRINNMFIDGSQFIAQTKAGHNLQMMYNSADKLDLDINAGFVQLWPSNETYIESATADTITITSTDPGDTLAGTGSQVLLIDGVDANWNFLQEIVPVTALPITTTSSFLRVNRTVVVFSGSATHNIGELSFRHTGSGNLQCLIPPSKSVHACGVIIVPKGQQLHLKEFNLSAGRTAGANQKPLVEVNLLGYYVNANTCYTTSFIIDTDDHPLAVFNTETLPSWEPGSLRFTVRTDQNDTFVQSRTQAIHVIDPNYVP